jgi:glutathione S-transferase
MRILYHFQASPFSRRTRLSLAHKELGVSLRDARENPAWLEEARRLVPLKTVPVLVDGPRALGDSNAISHWLERAYPDSRRLWPDGDDAFAAHETAALVDVALGAAIDLGTRYFALHDHPAWARVKVEIVGRAQLALEALAQRASLLGRATIAQSGWSAADMWLFTGVAWFEAIPTRAATNPNIAQILTLGLTLPSALSKWADAHRDRADIRVIAGRGYRRVKGFRTTRTCKVPRPTRDSGRGSGWAACSPGNSARR